MLKTIAPMLRQLDRLHGAGFDIFLGLNTRDGLFSVSVSKHPYKYGDVEEFGYRHMKINESTVAIVSRKLAEVNGMWEQGIFTL